MDWQIIPVAEADVMTLIKSINKVVINPLILFLFALAMVYFLYGLAQYLLSPDNEEVRKKSKSVMLWGIIGLFIMVAVFGIMRLILGTLGETKVKINNVGDYTVNGDAVTDKTVANNKSTGQTMFQAINSPQEDLPSFVPTSQPNVSSYTTSPFETKYEPNALCWRAEMYKSNTVEFNALKDLKKEARTQYLAATGQSDATTSKSYPVVYFTKTLVDTSSQSSPATFYVWWDVRGPFRNGKDSDCNLKEVDLTANLPAKENESTKPNPLKGIYRSDEIYYRIVGSGSDVNFTKARTTAVQNALIDIAKEKKIGDINALQYSILPEEKYYPQDARTHKYDYWLVVESEKPSKGDIRKTGVETRPNPLKTYASDFYYFRVFGTGSASTVTEARNAALQNAITELKKTADLVNTPSNYSILEEKYYYPTNLYPTYDYWIELQYHR